MEHIPAARSAMAPLMRAACIMMAATAVLSSPAAADRGTAPASRKAVPAAPIKDCTRFNGRFGYYGNPWCTPAEQARWDRYEARRLVGR
jgi:hypothetical protein